MNRIPLEYSHAPSVDQMSAAWNAEIDRVFETPITGGGESTHFSKHLE
jgi:hypothetical protein